MFDGLKKQQAVIFFFTGIAIGLLFWLLNPFSLNPRASIAVSIALLMIFWWISEALPMPVVALVPLVLQPLTGISSMEEVTGSYSNSVIFLFMGGFMIGLAIEKWNLHKRIALKIVSITGASGDRIILGFILATGFLSMWLSNTATTMMMYPIALSVISVIKEHEKPGRGLTNFAVVMMLVIAYASNFGGMATIIGTPPNVAFVAYIEKKYGVTIEFFKWIIVCTPLSLALLITLYLVLTKWLYPNHIKSSHDAEMFIQSEFRSLGKMSPAEKRVLFVFIGTALLWITKDVINSLKIFRLDDSMIAIAGAITLFSIPSGEDNNGRSTMLLEWADTKKMAWGILLLFGGGIALASSLEKAGVIAMIGQGLAGFSHINTFLLILLIATISIFISELMSNVAQVIVFAPVMAALADALHLNPVLLGLPMTLAASAASMLPMGTPPNAIVFGSGYLRLKDMLKAGFVMNVVSILVITLFCYFVLPVIINFSQK